MLGSRPVLELVPEAAFLEGHLLGKSGTLASHLSKTKCGCTALQGKEVLSKGLRSRAQCVVGGQGMGSHSGGAGGEGGSKARALGPAPRRGASYIGLTIPQSPFLTHAFPFLLQLRNELPFPSPLVACPSHFSWDK